MLDSQVTMVGNLVADPRMSTTLNGHRVATFRIASTPRRLDRGTGEWHDGETFFASVTCWRGTAENAMASLKKGHSVLVWGRVSQREYQTQAGETRQPVEIDAIALGPDLSRAVTIVKRAERSQSAGSLQRSNNDDDQSVSPVEPGSVEAIDWEYAGAPPEDEIAFGDLEEAGTEVEPAAGAEQPAPELVGAAAGSGNSGGLMGALGRAKGRAVSG